jgi:hypothetical protein
MKKGSSILTKLRKPLKITWKREWNWQKNMWKNEEKG